MSQLSKNFQSVQKRMKVKESNEEKLKSATASWHSALDEGKKEELRAQVARLGHTQIKHTQALDQLTEAVDFSLVSLHTTQQHAHIHAHIHIFTAQRGMCG